MMLKGLFPRSGVVSKILILVGISCFLLVFAAIIFRVVLGSHAQDASHFKLKLLVESVSMFVLPPFALAYLCSSKPIKFLHIDRRINWLHVAQVVVFMLMIIPAVNLLTSINQQLVLPKAFQFIETRMKDYEDQMAKLTEQLLNVHSLQALAFNLFLIAMIPAFGEELFFRGAVQGIIQEKMNVKFAIWITAIVFSAIHLQFYGFFPRMLLGAFFGYLLFWSENLWLPIAAHFTNNAVAIVFYYLKYNGYKLPDIDTIGTGNTLWLGLVSAAFALFGFFLFKKLFFRQSCVHAES